MWIIRHWKARVITTFRVTPITKEKPYSEFLHPKFIFPLGKY